MFTLFSIINCFNVWYDVVSIFNALYIGNMLLLLFLLLLLLDNNDNYLHDNNDNYLHDNILLWNNFINDPILFTSSYIKLFYFNIFDFIIILFLLFFYLYV